jgi:LemA protein
MTRDPRDFTPKRTPTTMESGAIGKGCLVGIGLLVLVLVLVAMTIGHYNGLVDRQEETRRAFGVIDSEYKRRFDLVPNLVATVEGVAGFEKSTLTAVTEARASVGRATLPAGLPAEGPELQGYLAAQQSLGSALQRLLVVSENYPELRATGNFTDLQHQLEGTENRINVARVDYLEVAKEYNAAIRKFPANLLAGMFHFERATELPTLAEERVTPKVDFGDQ